MREITVTKRIYKFKELSEDAQNEAIKHYIMFMVETIPVDEISKNSNFYKAYRKSEEMKTPWFFSNYVWEYCKNQILAELKEYEFEEDGTVYC